MTFVIGVDPGKDGGVVFLRSPGELVAAYRMPETEADIIALFRKHTVRGRRVAYLEVAHPMPKQGLTSTFTSGKGYGFLRAAILGARIKLVDVRAVKWQEWITGARKRPGEEYRPHKRRLRGLAQQRFPGVEVTLKTADALLIAEYGMAIERGVVQPKTKEGPEDACSED